MSTSDRAGLPSPAMAPHLGYLLKHVQQLFADVTAAGLAPLGISGREAAVLRTIAGLLAEQSAVASQGEVAQLLGVDRTSMVALIDELERKGLVERRQDPDDRRKNVIELTADGRATLAAATTAGRQAEAVFLAPLTSGEAEQLRRSLQALLFTARTS